MPPEALDATHRDPGAAPDVRAGRLAAAEYTARFGDVHPPPTRAQALIEAERCLGCYDAPCVTACPTGIDVPGFIHRIVDGNLRGAAKVILEANVFGGMCARVCPTEVLCEQACVRHTAEDRPVEIGLLQRHATDLHLEAPGRPLFARAAPTGRRIAVVGSGPAGLACAHRAARFGQDIVVFEARGKAGGLNEFGIAAYKTVDGFAQREIAWLLSIGGIEIHTGHALGVDLSLAALAEDYDAVFLAVGLGGANRLDSQVDARLDAGHDAHDDGSRAPAGVVDAVDFIADVRQACDYATLPVGRRVVVLGGGMTAIDAAVQSRLLGAEEVTIVYRRDRARMPASRYEQEWAQRNHVTIRTWSVLESLAAPAGHVGRATFAEVRDGVDGLEPTGRRWSVAVDTVLKAIGQTLVLADRSAASLALRDGRIATDDEGRTSLDRVWAGGDCTWGGRDLTVEAVEHGKVAAHSMHRALGGTTDDASARRRRSSSSA